MTTNVANLMKYGSRKAIKDYIINPKGLTTKHICTLPKEKRNFDFLNWKMDLYRIGEGKEVEKNVATFKVDLRMSKPEIKQYIEKVYGLEVERVNTLRTHGSIKKNMIGQRYKRSDHKKAYVFLKNIEVPEFYRKATFLL